MSQDFTPIQIEIARQLHVQKPTHLRPGIDVLMAAVKDEGRDGIGVHVRTDNTLALVYYDQGADHYVVARKRHGQDTEILDRIYCDQLGEIVFGSDAVAFDEPMVRVFAVDDDGTMREV